MRHQVAGKHLNRTSAHRTALRRNLAASLFEHGNILTTREKAKFVQPFAEKLITLAKKGSLHARRRAIALLQDRDICTVEDGQPVKVTSVIQRLFSELGPQFKDRNGGYTRILNLPHRRIGDNGKLVLLQLIGETVSSHAVKATTEFAAPQVEQSAPPTVDETTENVETDEKTPADQPEEAPSESTEEVPKNE
ncbi:MAG: 50S ribosomal protein L17 [Sedimentisphaerales bacterium]|nr:50S ribosomal protein L17 [Sedimentisphaerales bacterium]